MRGICRTSLGPVRLPPAFQTSGFWLPKLQVQTLISPDNLFDNPDIQPHATLLYHEGLLVSERLSGNPNWLFTASMYMALPAYPEARRATSPVRGRQSRGAKKISAWYAEDTNSAPVISDVWGVSCHAACSGIGRLEHQRQGGLRNGRGWVRGARGWRTAQPSSSRFWHGKSRE